MNDQVPKREMRSADIARVMKLLPHRYPFLLIDKIIEMEGDHSAIGIKAVTVNEPFFQGHFPQFPVMPGVLLIEGMAQTAGALSADGHSVVDLERAFAASGAPGAESAAVRFPASMTA